MTGTATRIAGRERLWRIALALLPGGKFAIAVYLDSVMGAPSPGRVDRTKASVARASKPTLPPVAAAVVGDEQGTLAGKATEGAQGLGRGRGGGHVFRANAGQRGDVAWNTTAGRAHKTGELLAHDPLAHLHTGSRDLDDVVVVRGESGGLEVENDELHGRWAVQRQSKRSAHQ